jgi:tetratricopeptide (TPR) repeat protein
VGQRFESSRARQIITMKKILILSLFFFSILHPQIRAETVYDLLISGEREKGITILRDLAENDNNKDAMYVLGLLYNDASSINLCSIDDFCLGQNFSNYKEAKKIFTQLYQNHNDPRAAYALGEYYDDHWYFSSNYKKAFNYYLFSAERGVPEAQFNVANMYEHGDGVKKDLTQSVRWYLQCNTTSLCGAGVDGIDDLIDQLTGEQYELAKSLVEHGMKEVDIRITTARQVVSQ